MNSISTRLLVSTALILASFFVLTALSLTHSVHSRAQQAQRDRMQGLVYGILGAAELDSQGRLQINEFSLPDGRLMQAQSGLVARVFDAQNREVWRSQSTIEAVSQNTMQVPTGRWRFRQQESDSITDQFSLRFGFSWATADEVEREFNILLIADATEHRAQLAVFDRNLWISLLTSALLLLMLQLYVLMWGLKPLGKMSRALQRIQQGKDDKLDTKQLAHELTPVANSLNMLLHSEQNRRTRYKNVMNDLAHSLKTPLSIMLNLAQDKTLEQTHRQTLNEQSARMKDIIAYHIRRASVSGSRPLGPAIQIKPIIDRLVNSLHKVYAQRKIEFKNELDSNCQVRLDESDLMEIFGNLLENACKYGASKIQLHCTRNDKKEMLRVIIDDNGPGFPEQINEELLERGKRADTRVDGQGLGLAVSSELLSTYGGRLKLGRAEELGGARITLYFSATI